MSKFAYKPSAPTKNSLAMELLGHQAWVKGVKLQDIAQTVLDPKANKENASAVAGGYLKAEKASKNIDT